MRTYDLIVVGAGSGNMLLGPETEGLRTAIVESDRFGGTCLNRGCIPSKMYVLAADAVRGVHDAARLGVTAEVTHADWAAVRDRIFGRIDPIHDKAVLHREREGTDVFTHPARFVAPKVLQVGDETITAEHVVVAVGSRPSVPDIPGLDSVPFHTSDTIMRVDSAPRSVVIIGGGYIAAEFGHVLDAFGATVSIVQRSPRLLMGEDHDVSSRYTLLAAARYGLHLDSTVHSVAPGPEGVVVTVDRPDGRVEVHAEAVLVAAGRVPNTDHLDAAAGGLDLDAHGHIVVDPTGATSVPGVWSFGDSSNHFQLKHIANDEMRVIRHNMFHPDQPRRLRTGPAPHAVFTDPQIAGAGLTEEAARGLGHEPLVSTRFYRDTAYGWALEDTTSFVKVLADPATRLVLGAHAMGPQAATLLQPLIQAMMLGTTVDQLAHDVLYVHPALTEVVEQALLDL